MFDLEGLHAKEGQGVQVDARLRVLEIRELQKLACIWKIDCSSSTLGGIQRFQNLSMLHVFNCNNLSSISMLHVFNCNNLSSILSPVMAKHLENLSSLRVEDCSMVEEIVAPDDHDGQEKAALAMTESEMVIRMIVLPQLKYLLLINLPKLKSFCQGVHAFEFPSLEEALIINCPEMRTFSYGHQSSCDYPVIDGHHNGQHLFKGKVSLTSISRLYFHRLENLTEIWYGELDAGSFSKLSFMSIYKCPKLLNIFPLNSIARLEKLEKLEVDSCDSLEVLFHFEGLNMNGGSSHAVVQAFDCLKKLKLSDLPNLKYLWSWRGPHEVMRGFKNLTSLKVRGCHSLRNLFTPSVAELLLNLQHLEITGCNMIEQVIMKENDDDHHHHHQERIVEDIVVLPRINTLRLGYLPNLTSFCAEAYIINWPFLWNMAVHGCPKLKTFVPGAPSTPQLYFVGTESGTFDFKGDLNANHARHFERKAIRGG